MTAVVAGVVVVVAVVDAVVAVVDAVVAVVDAVGANEFAAAFVAGVDVAYVLQYFLRTEPQAKAAVPRWKKLILAAVE